MTDVVDEAKGVAGPVPAGAVDEQLVRQLSERAREEGLRLTGEGGLLARLTKIVVESALEGEMEDHLGYARHDPAGRDGGNSRNGTRSKELLTEAGPVQIAVPRDRDGSFAPQLVRKRQRRLSGLDDLVISLSAKGLTHGEICAHLLGRRRVFVFGLVVFSIASLLIGLSPSGWWAIAGRAVQGIGAAIVAPASLSLLTLPEGRGRTRAVALYGATAGIGASLGLVIGGALAHWISWRAGFFVNVPIGAAMIALAPRFIPETGRASGRFDVFGALSATLGVGALVFGIVNTADAGWTSPATLTAVAVGVFLLIAFVLIERRAAQPIMPLRLFASRRRTGAYLARFLYLGAMIGFFFITQFLQEVVGFDPLQAGMGFLPMTAVNFAVAMSIPRLVGKVPGSIPLVAGVLLTLAGMFWLSRVGVDSGDVTGVALPMVLIGAGQGLAFAPLTSFGIIGAPAADAGAASGLVNTFHQVGTCLGLGIGVAAAATVPTSGPAVAHLASQVSVALTTGSILLLLALVVTAAFILPADLAAHRTKKQPGTVPAPQVQQVR